MAEVDGGGGWYCTCTVCGGHFETLAELLAHRGEYFGLSVAESNGLCSPSSPRKYGNVPTPYDGVTYDSQLEAQVARELDRIKGLQPPLILAWKRQVPYKLGRRGRFRLVVDFDAQLSATRDWVSLDAKGFETPASKIKRAWFEETYSEPVYIIQHPAEVAPLLERLSRGAPDA